MKNQRLDNINPKMTESYAKCGINSAIDGGCKSLFSSKNQTLFKRRLKPVKAKYYCDK